jgi:acetoacetyl-CoA synthetase
MSTEPELLYDPDPEQLQHARVQEFLRWLASERGVDLSSWNDLQAWSVREMERFWAAIWDYFEVRAHTPYETVLEERRMPGARWFPGATLNYAEHCFGTPAEAGAGDSPAPGASQQESRDSREREERGTSPAIASNRGSERTLGAGTSDMAIIAYSQTRPPVELTFAELAEQVRRVRAGLRRLGVGRGDRVVAYLPNCPETVVAFLATASLGAIWASCAPEFGALSVIDRFGQIEPTVMLAVAGYTYGDKPMDRRAEVARIRAGLPSVRHVVHVPYGPHTLPDTVGWAELVAPTSEPLDFEPVPFDHPLYVLFSSGTTGRPKAIVHGHGGILIEHLKHIAFNWDLGPGDRLLWYASTAWMLWNAMVSALLVRSTLVLFDGNPLYPDLREQWRLVERSGVTLLGTSPAYLMACRKEGIAPMAEFDLSRLRQMGVGGSPFPAEGYRWVADQFADSAGASQRGTSEERTERGGEPYRQRTSRMLLNVGSGGTDVCTALVQGSPLQPVWVGEMSGPSLGVDVKAFDEKGNVVVGELGELVITSPMPSMPVGFWGDEDGSRLHEAYFAQYPGAFRFGDWCRFSALGTCIITGRSDATLNRGGVRLGTGEFYRVLQDLPEIADSVVVHLEDPAGGVGELILFVVPRQGVPLDEPLRQRLATEIRTALSPRHVPDRIVSVPAIPYSRTGKKLEVPVKKILRGVSPDAVASPGALVDPTALDAFVEFARVALLPSPRSDG